MRAIACLIGLLLGSTFFWWQNGAEATTAYVTGILAAFIALWLSGALSREPT